MTKPMIGILAGMGARSTAPFVDMVISQCQAQYGARHDPDFPHIMIYSLPTPIYMGQHLDHDKFSGAIVTGLQKLAGTGVDFIAMPCNTAHLYHEALAASIRVPLLNMIEGAVERLPSRLERVGLLATRWTVDGDLYQGALAHRGREAVTREQWQVQVDEILDAVKAGGALSQAQAGWQKLLIELQEAGLDGAILACTDLNPANSGVPEGFHLLDATDSLAQATVAHWLTSSDGADPLSTST